MAALSARWPSRGPDGSESTSSSRSASWRRRPPAVGDARLLLGPELGERAPAPRPTLLGEQEERIVAEAVPSARRGEDSPPHRSLDLEPQVPRGSARARAQTKRAPRRSSPTPARRASRAALLAASSPCAPAKRAERTPGAPPRASTSRPESSASAQRRAARAAETAFRRRCRGRSPGPPRPRAGRPGRRGSSSSWPSGASRRSSSARFFWLFEATRICTVPSRP